MRDEHAASVQISGSSQTGSDRSRSGNVKTRKIVKTTIHETSAEEGGEDGEDESPRFVGHVKRKPQKFPTVTREEARHHWSGSADHPKPDKFGRHYSDNIRGTSVHGESEEMEEEGAYNEDCGGEAEYFVHTLPSSAFSSPLTKPAVAATANWNSNDPFVFQGKNGFTGPGDDYYLQIEFGASRRVTGWKVTGNGQKHHAGAVEAYTVRLHDPSQKKWSTILGPEGQPRVFSGAPSADPDRTGDVYPVKIAPKRADGIRFYPLQWSGKPYFKVDVQACREIHQTGGRRRAGNTRKLISTVTEEEEEESDAAQRHPKPQKWSKEAYGEMAPRRHPYGGGEEEGGQRERTPVSRKAWSKHPADAAGNSGAGAKRRRTQTVTEERWSKQSEGREDRDDSRPDDRSSRMRGGHWSGNEYVAGANAGSAARSKTRKVTSATREEETGDARGGETPKEPHPVIEPSVERIPGGPPPTLCKRIPLRDLQYFEIDYDKRVQDLGADPDIMADGYVNLRLLTAETSQQNKNNHLALEVDFGRTRPIQQLLFKGMLREGMPAIMQAFYLQFYDPDTHVWQWVSQDNQPKPFILFQHTKLNKKEVQTIFPVRFTQSLLTRKLRIYPELWINLPLIRMGVIACG
ncbi:uncharacterized protein LOC129596388 isoform X2 [Paramacrobiotus metropolitanus]|nr:uncharacterized protein LOC129596388 isoform X2 [Paramacrobiotus metropolitanus]